MQSADLSVHRMILAVDSLNEIVENELRQARGVKKIEPDREIKRARVAQFHLQSAGPSR